MTIIWKIKFVLEVLDDEQLRNLIRLKALILVTWPATRDSENSIGEYKDSLFLYYLPILGTKSCMTQSKLACVLRGSAQLSNHMQIDVHKNHSIHALF